MRRAVALKGGPPRTVRSRETTQVLGVRDTGQAKRWGAVAEQAEPTGRALTKNWLRPTQTNGKPEQTTAAPAPGRGHPAARARRIPHPVAEPRAGRCTASSGPWAAPGTPSQRPGPSWQEPAKGDENAHGPGKLREGRLERRWRGWSRGAVRQICTMKSEKVVEVGSLTAPASVGESLPATHSSGWGSKACLSPAEAGPVKAVTCPTLSLSEPGTHPATPTLHIK